MSKLSIETEFDKNNKVIADTKSDCMLLTEFNMCNPANCVNCKTYKLVNELYNKCVDIDKLAIDQLTGRMYSEKYSVYKSRYKKYFNIASGVMSRLFTAILIVVISIIIIGAIIYNNSYRYLYPKDDVLDYTYKSTIKDDRLYEILYDLYSDTHDYISDINNDGCINCIDYAVTFKMIYDNKQINEFRKANCEIVRNTNEHNYFNHLFIRIRHNSYSAWEYIEPQNIIPCTVSDAWGSRYNPVYNHYGETKRWLNILKIKQ